MTNLFPVVIHRPRASDEDTEWLVEVATAELAIQNLLNAKRATFKGSPEREQILWTRYYERLRLIKRHLDAVVM